MSRAGRSPGNVVIVVGTLLLVGLALGGDYLRRTTTNSDLLTQRNLRTLGRMSEYLEARINNFESILSHFSCPERLKDVKGKLELPDLTREFGLPIDMKVLKETDKKPPFSDKATLEVEPGGSRLRLYYSTSCQDGERDLQAGADLRSLAAPILSSDDFETIVLADSRGLVIYQDHESAVVVDHLPELAVTAGAALVSAVREASLAGRPYRLFVQPVRLDLPPTRAELGRGPTPRDTTTWILAGLVPASRFHSESLAFDPNEILALGLLLIGAVLAWPFLKLWCLGPFERIEVRDVLFMGFSYIVASGLAGLFLADLAYYPQLTARMDETLCGIGARLEDNLRQELDTALNELESRSREYNHQCAKHQGEDDAGEDDAWHYQENIGASSYPALRMLVWMDAQGQQVAKWTVGKHNTPSINVAQREYFRRVHEGRAWPRPGGGQYFLESILSLNTGAHLAAVSIPHPPAEGCHDAPAVAVLITRLDATARPILPPGFGFAIVDSGGRTLFHHLPHHNGLENFLEETGSHPLLASLLRSRRADVINAVYQGRDSRLFVTPVEATPLSAVVYFDKTYERTVNAEALLSGGTLIVVHGVVLLLLFAVGTCLVAPSPMRWAWPHRNRPDKYRRLNLVLGLFAGSLVIQVAFFSPHLSLFLVPFQALGLAVVVITAVFDDWDRRRIWGWIATATATALLVVCHGLLPADGAGAVALPLLQLLALVPAVVLTRRFESAEVEVREDLGECPKGSVSLFYVAAIVVVLGIAGLAPGYVAFRLGSAGQIENLVRYGQLQIADELYARGAGQQEAKLDLFEPFFETCYQGAGTPPAAGCPGATAEAVGASHGVRVHDFLERVLGRRLPFLGSVSTSLRGLYEPRAADGAWSWQRRQGNLLHLAWRPDTVHPGAGHPDAGHPEAGARMQVVSRLPGDRSSWVIGVFGTGTVLLLLGALARWQNRRIFLLDLNPPDHLFLDDILPDRVRRSLLIICTRATSRAAFKKKDSEYQYVDLIRCSARGRLPDSIHPEKVLCLDYFDHRLDEPAWNVRLLEFLEEHIYTQRHKVVLLSSSEPERLLMASGHAGEKPDVAEERRLRERRWMRLLGQCVKLTAAAGIKADEIDRKLAAARFRQSSDRLPAIVDYECEGTHRLREIGCQVRKRPDFDQLDPGALIDQIREMAENYYRALWAILSDEERLLLAQLARGAVVHPECRKPLRRLLARGLLRRDPELRLFNESFGRFLRETVSDDEIAGWERVGARSAWQTLRVPLFLTLVMVAVFLFATQRELFNTAIAFLSALTIGVPAFFKVLSMVGQGSGKKVPAPDA